MSNEYDYKTTCCVFNYVNHYLGGVKYTVLYCDQKIKYTTLYKPAGNLISYCEKHIKHLLASEVEMLLTEDELKIAEVICG